MSQVVSNQITWSDEMVKALINAWATEMVQKIMDGSKRNSDAYNIISTALCDSCPALADVDSAKVRELVDLGHMTSST